MEGSEKQRFQITSAVGVARPSYIEATQGTKKVNLERVREMIEKGDKSLFQGHEVHAKMIRQEAGGEKIETGLPLIHAEDQLMSAESFRIIVDEIIQNYERIIALEGKIK